MCLFMYVAEGRGFAEVIRGLISAQNGSKGGYYPFFANFSDTGEIF